MFTWQTFGYEMGKATVFFFMGFATGWIVRGIRDKSNSSINNEKVIALLVAGIWAVSVIVDMINPSYETPIAIHGLMGGIVGFYYKDKLTNKKK